MGTTIGNAKFEGSRNNVDNHTFFCSNWAYLRTLALLLDKCMATTSSNPSGTVIAEKRLFREPNGWDNHTTQDHIHSWCAWTKTAKKHTSKNCLFSTLTWSNSPRKPSTQRPHPQGAKESFEHPELEIHSKRRTCFGLVVLGWLLVGLLWCGLFFCSFLIRFITIILKIGCRTFNVCLSID